MLETNCVVHLLQKRLAKEARIQELQTKNAALGKKVKESAAVKAIKGRGEASYYKVTCKVRSIHIFLLLLCFYASACRDYSCKRLSSAHFLRPC